MSTNKGFTIKEMAAIKALKQIAKIWPQTLTLFSWSGTLVVIHTSDYNDQSISFNDCSVEGIPGIPNDGGDPD